LKAHIEQGPLLENARKNRGCRHRIQGLRWFNIDVCGKSITPARRRSHCAGMRCATQSPSSNALTELTHDPADVTRFTVGRMLVTPNSPNSVASHVLFSVDVRHPIRKPSSVWG